MLLVITAYNFCHKRSLIVHTVWAKRHLHRQHTSKETRRHIWLPPQQNDHAVGFMCQ